MNCADCVELIARRLDRSLPEPEAGALEAHLAACPRCRAEMALQVQIARALAMPDPEPSGRPVLAPDFARVVSRRAFEASRREKRAQRWNYLTPIAASAVVLLLAILYRSDIAATLAPSFSVLGRLAGAGAGWTGASLAGAFGRAPDAAAPTIRLICAWGSLACAAAIIALAASKIYSPARR